MAKRHRDAVAIQHGACNPSAIARSIVSATDEIRDGKPFTGTDQITSDPAIRLMVHQLAFICGMGDNWPDNLSYVDMIKLCEENSGTAL